MRGLFPIAKGHPRNGFRVFTKGDLAELRSFGERGKREFGDDKGIIYIYMLLLIAKDILKIQVQVSRGPIRLPIF